MGNTVSEPQAGSAAAKAKRYTGLGLIIALIALVLDQGVKLWVENSRESPSR